MKNNPQLSPWIINQNEWWIQTLDNSLKFPAKIYSEEQRDTIRRLIQHGYYPTHTSPGKAKCTKKRWNLEKYRGRHGIGFRMVSSYVRPYTLGGYVRSNMNSITYFIRQAS